MKNNKGITLVALVITIIVLLILAGVTIASLSGDNGILTRGAESKEATEIGEAKDQVNLAINEGTTEYYAKKYAATPAGTEKKSTEIIAAIDKACGKTSAGETYTGGKIGNAKVDKTTTKAETNTTVYTLTTSKGTKQMTLTVDISTSKDGEVTWATIK